MYCQLWLLSAALYLCTKAPVGKRGFIFPSYLFLSCLFFSSSSSSTFDDYPHESATVCFEVSWSCFPPPFQSCKLITLQWILLHLQNLKITFTPVTDFVCVYVCVCQSEMTLRPFASLSLRAASWMWSHTKWLRNWIMLVSPLCVCRAEPCSLNCTVFIQVESPSKWMCLH